MTSRPAPPEVPPIEHDGVRYQQDDESRKHGGDQSCGYLVAIDIQSGVRLWMLKIYECERPTPGSPPPMSVYFKTMKHDAILGIIEIEREFGGKFEVDIKRRSVWQMDFSAGQTSQTNDSYIPSPPIRKPK